MRLTFKIKRRLEKSSHLAIKGEGGKQSSKIGIILAGVLGIKRFIVALEFKALIKIIACSYFCYSMSYA